MSDLDLVALDATALAQEVRARRLAARDVIEATLQRIDQIEPDLNAFRVVMGDDALADADRLDSLPDRDLRSLRLAGVPVAIKDDTDVAGQSTGWGSALDRGPCEHDAEVVHRLRNAGAIVIGKTNVPELPHKLLICPHGEGASSSGLRPDLLGPGRHRAGGGPPAEGLPPPGRRAGLDGR